MRIVRVVPVCLLAVIAVACGTSPTAPTTNHTTATASTAASANATAALLGAKAAANTNCQPTAWNNVIFSTSELGKVTVKNDGTCAADYLFVVWDARNADRKTIVASTHQNVPPGATVPLTVGVPDQCGQVYERDVYFGITRPDEKDLRNFQPQWAAQAGASDVLYATGSMWKTTACDQPPSKPPVGGTTPPPSGGTPPPSGGTPPQPSCEAQYPNGSIDIHGSPLQHNGSITINISYDWRGTGPTAYAGLLWLSADSSTAAIKARNPIGGPCTLVAHTDALSYGPSSAAAHLSPARYYLIIYQNDVPTLSAQPTAALLAAMNALIAYPLPITIQ